VKKKQFFIHTVLYTAAPKLPSIAGFFILPFITPYLSLKDYGKFGLVIACYSLFSLSTTLGQNVILQNSFFEYKNKFNLVWKRSYGLMFVGSILGAILLAITLFFLLGKTFNKECLIVTGICVVALICSPIETIAQVYYILKERPYAIALRAMIMSLLNILILLITIKYLRLGYIGLVTGFASSSFFSLLFYIYPICIKQHIYPIFFFKKKHVYEYLKVGLPLLPHYLSLSIFNTSDRLLLAFYKIDVARIGLYSQGYGIGANAMVFINGVFSAIAKTLQVSFREKAKENRIRLRVIFVSLMGGVGIFFFNIALWMKEIYAFLFRKPELQIGYPVAILVLMAHIFFPLYSFAVYSLFISKQTKLVARITLTAAAMNSILNLIFIPIFNIWAALLTTSFSFMFLGIIVLFIKEVKLQLAWVFPRLNQVYILCIIYGISITLLVWFLKDSYWYFKLLISITSVLMTVVGFYYRKNIFEKRHLVIRTLNEKIKNIS
jgi:O-antigen/teichoic acid export membrane protein